MLALPRGEAVERNKPDDDRAAYHLVDVYRDLGRVQRVAEQSHEEGAEQGAVNPSDAAIDADAADDTGAHDIENKGWAREIRRRRSEPASQHDAADARHQPGEDIAERNHLCAGNSGDLCRFWIYADRIEPAAVD